MSESPQRAPDRDPDPGRRTAAATGYRWLSTGSLLIAFAGSAPSGLYPLYQETWAISEQMLTVAFSAFIMGILVALTTLVPLSDRVERRAVLAAAVLCTVVAVVGFMLSEGLHWILPAGFLTGLGVGAYQGTVNAALVDMLPAELSGRATLASTRMGSVGLAAGPLTAGQLGQFAPAPLRLLFVLELAALVPLAVAILRTPGTSERVAGMVTAPPSDRIRPRRAWVPLAFAVAFVSFAAGAVINALGSSIFVKTLGVDNLAVGGVVVALLFASSALAQPLVLRLALAHALRIGLFVSAVGVTGTALAVAEGSPAGLLAATAVTGAGQGCAYAGSLALLNARAEDRERGTITGRYYTFAYCGAFMPVLATGAAISELGIAEAVLLFACCLGAVSLGIATAAGPVLRGSRR